MKKTEIQFFILFSIILISSCVRNQNHPIQIGKSISTDSLKYAELFKISRFKDFIRISVLRHSSDSVLNYFLIDRNHKIPDILKNENIIRTPVRKVVCLSTTHIAFIDLLNATRSIIGISGKDYVYNSKLRKRIESDSLADVGYENNLDLEFLIREKPDVVFVYDVDGEISQTVNKLKSIGIQTIQVNEYRERKVLGQTEWLKFFACFYEKSDSAVKKFDEISNNYENLKKLTLKIKQKPSVLVNLPWKGVWYIAGGKTNIAELIADAGANYFRKNDDSEGNPAVPFETVFQIADTAQFWINPGQALSKSDILQTDDRLMNFEAMKKDRIYNRNGRLNASGGNDYMESGVVRPDLILKDLIYIFHPELLPKHHLYYYLHLE